MMFPVPGASGAGLVPALAGNSMRTDQKPSPKPRGPEDRAVWDRMLVRSTWFPAKTGPKVAPEAWPWERRHDRAT